MPGMLWLDNHIHISEYGPDGRKRPHFAEDLRAVLDAETAYDLRFVVNPDAPYLGRIRREPEAMFEAARFIRGMVAASSGRLYGSCMVNPNFLDESLRLMDLCLGEWGFVELGEMLQYEHGYQMSSAATEAVVRRAVGFDVPVQVHISTHRAAEHPATWGLAQLEDLARLVERVPEGKYILAHAVGMPDNDPPVVEPYLDFIEHTFGRWPQNFWMEVRDFDSPGLRTALARVPVTRLLAGTDWLSRGTRLLPYGVTYLVIFGGQTVENNPYPPCVASLVGFLRAAGVDQAGIERIAWRNLAELLKLAL